MHKKITLPNGVRLVTAPMPRVESCAINILISVGSRYENKENNGISHFLEHMFFKGSKKYPSQRDISFAIEQLGGLVNAFTSEDITGYHLKTLPENFVPSLDILADILINPLLLEKELAKERKIIHEEINREEDAPARKVLSIFLNLLWPDSALGFRVIGNKKNIQAIKRADLIGFKKNFYRSRNIVISIAGKIDEDKVRGVIQKYFGGLENLPKNEFSKAETQKGIKCQIFPKETEQSHLVLGFPGLSFFDQDRFVLSVLNNLLGHGMSSRLFLSIRSKKGLAYSIYSFNDSFYETGVLAVHAGLNTKKIHQAIKAIFTELEDLKKKLVDKQELVKSKNLIKSSLLFGLEEPLKMSGFLGGQEVHKGKIETAEEKIREIERVTVEDIRRVASRIFDRENVKMAVIGPHKREQKQEFEELMGINH